MDRLDTYESMPSGARDYLSSYGWHFSKKLCENAVSHMKNKSNKHYQHDQVSEIFENNGLKIEDKDKYDATYLFNMFYSDFYPNTLKTEIDIVKAVNDILNDEDGYEGMALTRYYADCIGKGKPLFWEDYI